jgi:hypothetical protein
VSADLLPVVAQVVLTALVQEQVVQVVEQVSRPLVQD